MPTVQIVERGCRGCTLCVDLCPVKVFEMDAAGQRAQVLRPDDCIGCYSCVYVCPSRCVEIGGVDLLRPFHRIEEHAALVERFLKEPTLSGSLTEADLVEARADVAARLRALADAINESMGRGQKAVGRRAGIAAAAHLPEMYEGGDVASVLERLKPLFGFTYQVEDAGKRVTFDLAPCALCQVVRDGGAVVGEALLCALFHEYWAGLLSTFVGERFRCELKSAGDACRLEIVAG
jgi:NAD-dependent dihydropyrimidine dehydrogenase PreA subunit